MKLTIITINYNNAIGLKRTMDSVFSQSFVNFEYIVIDGASTDNSVDIIKSYSSDKLEHFIWKSEPDTGIYNAMNKGIKLAKGEYLLFLNSGDYLVNDTIISEIVEYNSDSSILVGFVKEFNTNKVINYPENITLISFMNRNIPHQGEFIKRTLFDKFGMYDESYKILADYKFNLLILLNDVSICKLSRCISIVEPNGISCNDNNFDLINNERKKIFSELLPNLVFKDYDMFMNKKTYSHPAILDLINSVYYLKFIKLIYRIRLFFNTNKNVSK